jgi:hypothetical protein
MGMSVGVTVGRISVGATAVGVSVGGIDVNVAVCGEDTGVDNTCTEKLQASSNSALNIKTTISGNHFRSFIAFSLA